MKKTKLIGLVTLLLSLGVVGCGGGDDAPKYESDKTYHWTLTEDGEVDKETKAKHDFGEPIVVTPATCSAKGSQTKTCKVCGYVATEDIKMLDHDYVVDASKAEVATCAKEGKTVEVCSVCHDEKVTTLPKLDHEFGTPTVISTAVAGTTSGVTSVECGTCHQKRIVVDALSYTKLEGKLKKAPDETLKLDTNGNYVEYKFTNPTAFTGKVALYGWVDYWKDGQNNNDQRGFTSRKDGAAGFNVELKINDTVVVITNTGTYESMGMTAGDGGNGSFTLCELGAATLPAGEVTLTYTRIESYNLNISQIVFF